MKTPEVTLAQARALAVLALDHADLVAQIAELVAQRDLLFDRMLVLKEVAKPVFAPVTRVVDDHFHIGAEDFQSHRRPQSICWPRQIAMALVYELGTESLAQVGRRFGGRDHGTVLNACNRVKDRCETEPATRALVEMLRARSRLVIGAANQGSPPGYAE